MSRSVIQTLTLHNGNKVLVLDANQVPAETPLYKVTHWGEVLPKGDKVEPKHLHTLRSIKTEATKDKPASMYKATRNADGKYKHHWDAEKDGPKVKKAKTKPAKEGGTDVAALKKQMEEIKALLMAKE